MRVDWDSTFEAVPRGAFAPDRLFHDGEWIDRSEQPQRWAELVASDIALTTQLDDGGNGNGTPTSSSSQPKVVRFMLHHLGAERGMRVLDVGTGTGWTAALLAHGLGDGNVTTIEVDPTVAAQAHERLKRSGLHPRTVIGDGYAGHPDGAPYDRVHATAAVQRVPRAWIEQTRPGGIILVPFGTPYCNGALLKLVVGEDGSAAGTFVEDVAFMWVRSQRPDSKPFDVDDVRYSPSTVDPCDVQQTHAAAFAIGLRLPGVTSMEVWAEHARWGTGRSEVWDGTSYAHCRYADWDAPHAVVESGPRDLWSELSGAYRWWDAAGRPGIERFGLTVTPDGHQTAWLDDPGQPVN
jgi:protein-L-isoaspartate(D-aspartate) O-methyltransferase